MRNRIYLTAMVAARACGSHIAMARDAAAVASADEFAPDDLTVRSADRFRAEDVDTKERTVTLVASSDAPVERYFGVEILGHNKGELRTDFIASGSAPVLQHHDRREQVGVIEDFTLDSAAGKLSMSVRFGKSERASEVMQDVADGIIRNVSVGYRIYDFVEVEDTDEDSPTTIRVTDWEVMEVSFVSIPADRTVGVGRSQQTHIEGLMEKIIKRHAAAGIPGKRDDGGAAAAPAAPAVSEAAIAVVLERMLDARDAKAAAAQQTQQTQQETAAAAVAGVQEIYRLAELHNARDFAEAFIKDGGHSAEAFRAKLALERLDGKAVETPAAVTGMSEKERRRYSVRNMLLDVFTEGQHNAGFEREVSVDIAKRSGTTPRGILVPMDIDWCRSRPVGVANDIRVMNGQRAVISGFATGGSQAGHLIAEEHRDDMFIDALRARLVVASLGARMLTGLEGNLDIPKLITSVAPEFIAESIATGPTEAAPVFGNVTMSPNQVSTFLDISRRMLLQSSPDVEDLIRFDMLAMIARKVDTVAIKGGGSNEPDGIMQGVSIGAVELDTNGGAPTWDMIVDLEQEVAIDNADVGALHYLTNPKVRGKLKKTPYQSGGAEGNFIWQPNGNELNGYGVGMSTLVPSDGTKGSGTALSTMIYGNFQELLVGFWSGVDVVRDPYTNSKTGAVRIAMHQDVDVALRHDQSFAVCDDIITT